MNKIERAIRGSLVYPKGFGSALTEKEIVVGSIKSVCGLDTEADRITAEPFLLTYSNQEVTNYIDKLDARKVVESLTSHKFRSTINFFFNLQYDFEGLLKLFPKDAALMIYGNGVVHLDESIAVVPDIQIAKHRVNYIPKKAFHFKSKGEKKYSYYDNLQYFQSSLDSASKKYLGAGKEDFDAAFTSKLLFEQKTSVSQEIKRFEAFFNKQDYDDKLRETNILKCEKFFSRFPDSESYRNTLLEYALIDSRRCRQLGEILVNGVNEFLNTRNFNSTATISEYYFRGKGIEMPKLPMNIQIKFLQSYYGGRFEILKKGFLDHVYMYDVKSAYPYAMSEMPVLSKHPVVKNVRFKHEDALFGTYCIETKIPKDYYISPLPVRDKLITFPVGHFERYWIDKISLELLEKMEIPFKIVKGIEIFDENADQRLKPLILELFAIKEDKSKPEVMRMAAKIILNSLYGKFVQLVDDTILKEVESLLEMDLVNPSDLFNICDRYYAKVHTTDFKTGKLFGAYYGAYITSHTRKILFETCNKYGMDKVIGMHTDSIIIKDRQFDCGKGLGAWEPDSMKKMNLDGTESKIPVVNANIVLLKSGFYQCEKDGATKIRSRGIGKTDTLLKEEFLVKRRFGLRQAVKKNFEGMNIIHDGVKIENNVNSDAKRKWLKDLDINTIKNGEWTDSLPLEIA